jgi:hypothetical protein
MISRFPVFSQYDIRHHRSVKDAKALRIPAKRNITVSQQQEVAKKEVRNFDWIVAEFEIRVVVSVSVLLFSMGMLATQRGDPGMYLPLLTSVLGYWTPSPTKK